MTKRFSTLLRLALASISICFLASAASAKYVITHDNGGNIVVYRDKFVAVRDSGEKVVIDGVCQSACTLVLSLLPRERICVTKRASLGFHAGKFPDSKLPSAEASKFIYSTYPPWIQKWVSANRALESLKVTSLQGAELEAMYARCPANRQTAVPPQTTGQSASR